MIDRYDVCNSGEVYKFDHGEWVRYDEAQARIAELEAALLVMVNHEVNYMDINNLGNPEEQHRIKQARAALKANPMTNANDKGE